MDLRLMAAVPTAAERAAVDRLLGIPETGWVGGPRSRLDGHLGRSGASARNRRHLLLPALHALQSDVGWISEGGLNYACQRLTVPPAEAYGVASFYALFSTEPRPDTVLHFCDDIACLPHGVDEPEVPPGASWVRSPCLGLCDKPPAVFVQRVGASDASVGGATSEVLGRLLGGEKLPDETTPVPQLGDPDLRLLRRVGSVDPSNLEAYRASGGYQALERAIEIGPEAVISEVETSRLLGRGGAAFHAGRKWAAVASSQASARYVICNADESEPGTFKDRILLEGDPFAVVEAMTIAGFAVGAAAGYLYVRGEYPVAAARMLDAISQARDGGLLGSDVMGAGFSFDIELRRGAGAYICGEETALMNSIEGYRGEPRNKPPFPTEVGLFGMPTLVNNVETLACVNHIVSEGGEAFAATGTEGSTGPKLFCVSGSVSDPGVFEVPFGTTLGELVELAGGLPEGRALRTVLLGGAAGSFVGAEALSMPLTFEDTRAAGLSLGSGAVIVYDDTVDIEAIVRRIAVFFRDESCGQCVPCRVGTVRQEESLARLKAGGSEARERELLADVAAVMTDASICGLGQTAALAVQSALRLNLIGGSG